jgi:DNA-binding MarR family transcriptional regulator
MTQVTPPPPPLPSLDSLLPPSRFETDEAGYLYDAAFRENVAKFARLEGEKLLRTEAFRALVMATKRLEHVIEAQLDDLGITYGQYKALMCIKNFGINGTQMNAVAGFLSVTPRNVTGLVDNLEAAGLVERVPDPADRRATIVRVTAAGETAATRGRRVHEALLGKLMGILSEEEMLQLRHLSTKLLRAVEEVSAGDRRKTNG